MRRTWMAAALVVGVATAASKAEVIASPRPIRPETRVWFTGSSTLRHFTCRAARVAGALALEGAVTRSATLAGANLSAEPSLRLAVDQLDCGIGRMNRHLRDALQAARHPAIEFRVATYEVELAAPSPVARIAGRLTIAGVERPVAVTAQVFADTLGALHVRGSTVIRPTEFGVELPRRFGGLIQVRDRVTVHFDVALDPDCRAARDPVAALAAASHTDLRVFP